jgi:large subunit ribosomal protein L15
MQQHELKPAPGSRRPTKRIGRGNASGHGTYATKGLKGQKARTGNDLRIGFEGGQMALIARLARKRGFTNKWRVEYEWVNVGQLNRAEAGGTVTPENLAAAGIIRRPHLPVKVLGEGEIDKALTVSAHAFTASARQKIEAAGGRIEQLAGPATERIARLATAAEVKTAKREAAVAAQAAAAELAAAPKQAEPAAAAPEEPKTEADGEHEA